MSDLLAARWQMAISLGFHIVFSCVGMCMPFLMMVSHWKWLKSKDRMYLDLTKAWSRGVAILFAVGAVSGTVLSFELGLLWPHFMAVAGPIFGMPFSLEGTAFFLEAIALGLFLYGWDRIHPWLHWLCGCLVGITGLLSGIFVVSANAWMNCPQGFDWIQGQAKNIDPIAAMFNDAWLSQALHMSLAAFIATGFSVAGVHAYYVLKHPDSKLHRQALTIALFIASCAALLQPISGDISAKDIARRQPLKLASAEALFETQAGAPLLIGGIPDEETRSVRYGLEIPRLLSVLVHGDADATVQGLDAFPKEEWPPVLVVHGAFQIMVGIGGILVIVALFYFLARFRWKQLLYHRYYLRILVLCAPLGFIAVEAGWIVTEVGRQPWIIYGIMTTQEALTPMPGLVVPFVLFTGVYLFLGVVVVWLMRRQFTVLSPP